MISIVINGKELDLPTELAMVRNYETDIFNRDTLGTDFTYPAELPLTDNNKAALGLPHIIANPNLKRDYDADLSIDGIYYSRVTVRLIKTALRTNTCSISIIGDYGGLARIMGDKQVNELVLGGIRTIGNMRPDLQLQWDLLQSAGTAVLEYQPCDSDLHMKDVANGVIVTDYAFPMAIDMRADLPIIHNVFNYPNKEQWEIPHRNIINPYYYDSGSVHGYRDPIKEYFETAMTDIPKTNDRFFWVPMFRLWFVIKKCFEEFGFTVESVLDSSLHFKNVLLYNTYAINRVEFTETQVTGQDYFCHIEHHATTIDPRNHVPRKKIREFLTEIGKAFNLQYKVDLKTMKVTINRLDTIPGTAERIDLSSIAVPNPEINFEQENFNKGYEFSFVTDPLDEAGWHAVKEDLSNYTLLGWTGKFADLPTAFPGAVAGDIAYVSAENAYYQFGGINWLFYSHNLGGYKTGSGDEVQKIETYCTPMPMQRFDALGFAEDASNHWGILKNIDYHNKMLLPYSSIGMEGVGLLGFDKPRYIIDVGTLPGHPSNGSYKPMLHSITKKRGSINPHLLNWCGMRKLIDGQTKLFPQGSCTSYDADGNLITGFANVHLMWATPSSIGLYHEWWKGFTQMLTDSVQVEWQLLWNSAVNNQVSLNSTVISIDGQNYLVRKGDIPMPFPSLATLRLVKI